MTDLWWLIIAAWFAVFVFEVVVLFCALLRDLRRRPKLTPLDNDRRPPPPDVLANALQDSIHKDTGRSRPARTVKED